jgi:uncharacterized protein (TIGR01777 family)
MVFALSGSTGFIGKALTRKLLDRSWEVRVIGRESFKKADSEFLEKYIEGCDVVINLAGAPVARKWTTEYKKEILESRVATARKISTAIGMAQQKPSLFISGSAIGIYDSQNTHTESSTAYAGSFLAEVCKAWEQEACNAEPYTRLVILRTGMVLGNEGGALARMHLPFRIGLGGKTGSGKQSVSYIHITDLIDAIVFIIENQSIRGVVNAVSPYPTTNEEFTSMLAKVLHQENWLTTPGFLLKFMYGEGAQVLLDGQKVLPEKLLQAGFSFRYPALRNALMRVYG